MGLLGDNPTSTFMGLLDFMAGMQGTPTNFYGGYQTQQAEQERIRQQIAMQKWQQDQILRRQALIQQGIAQNPQNQQQWISALTPALPYMSQENFGSFMGTVTNPVNVSAGSGVWDNTRGGFSGIMPTKEMQNAAMGIQEQPLVQIQNPGMDQYRGYQAKALDEARTGLINAGTTARTTLDDYNNLTNALGKISGGTGRDVETEQVFLDYANRFGLNINPERLGNLDYATAMTRNLVQNMLNAASGPQTDEDRAYAAGIVPRIGVDPEANQDIADYFTSRAMLENYYGRLAAGAPARTLEEEDARIRGIQDQRMSIPAAANVRVGNDVVPMSFSEFRRARMQAQPYEPMDVTIKEWMGMIRG